MKIIKNWALATLVLCFFVILAGGIVRSTQSGMGCPDFPTCFGSAVPPTSLNQIIFEPNTNYKKGQYMVYNDSLWSAVQKFTSAGTFNRADWKKDLRYGKVNLKTYQTWIEFVNRLLGALLGLFAIIQVYLLFKRRKSDAKAYKLAVAFLLVVILTGLFGAVVVKLNLAHLSVSVHLLFAIILTQIQLALLLTVSKQIFKKTTGHKARRILFLLLIVVFIQSAFGTAVRMYIDDVSKALDYEDRGSWLSPSNLPFVFLLHRTFSWIVFAAILYCAWASKKLDVLKPYYQRLFIIVLASATSGIVLYYVDFPRVAQPIHLLLASFAITQIVFMILYTKNKTDLIKDDRNSAKA
jgi:heme a synthase